MTEFGGGAWIRTMMRAVMDSLTHLFSSRRWPATRHRHSTAVNTQMDTTVVLLPPVPSAADAASSVSHNAAAMDSLSLSLAPCPLFLLPPCDGRFWRVARGLGNGSGRSARHGGTRGWTLAPVPAWYMIPGATSVGGLWGLLPCYIPAFRGPHAWAVGPIKMSSESFKKEKNSPALL